MPPLALAAAGPLIIGLASGMAASTIAISVGVAIAGALLQMALTPKQKTPGRDPRKVTVKSATAPRQVVYGRTMIKDPVLIHYEVTDNKKYLHLFLAYAGHEIDGFEDIYFNDEQIPSHAIDDDGTINAGRFAGFARIKRYTGAPDQTADQDAIDELPAWSLDDIGEGIAYLYVRLKGNATVFPAGVPTINAVVRGKKIYHYSDGSTRWTDNAALIAYDYLLDADRGFGAPASLIDPVEAAAHEAVCDQPFGLVETTITATSITVARNEAVLASAGLRTGDRVEVSGLVPTGLDTEEAYYWIRLGPKRGRFAVSLAGARSGEDVTLTADNGTFTVVRKAQPRYTINGTFLTNEKPLAVLEDLMGAMAGTPQLSAAAYNLRPGSDRSVVGVLTEDDLRGNLEVTPRRTHADLYNAVGGTFVDADAPLYTEAEFPEVASTVFAAQDGGRVRRDLAFSFLDDAQRAQRVALIDLAQSRQSITVKWPGKLNMLQYERGDLVAVTSARMGWEAKPFWVARDGFSPDDLGYDLTLIEYADGMFDLDADNMDAYDPAPDSNLIVPGQIDPPAGVTFATRPVSTSADTILYLIDVYGDASPDASATHYDARLFAAGDTGYESPLAISRSSSFPLILGPVNPSVEFVARLRAETWRGVQSDWVTSAVFNAADEVGEGSGSGPAAPTSPANTYEVVDVEDLTTSGTIVFSGGGGTGAAGSALGYDPGNSQYEFSVTMTNGGTGYTSAPSATINVPSSGGDDPGYTDTGTAILGNPSYAHLTWVDPADADLARVDIWRSDTNDSGAALRVSEVRAGVQKGSARLTGGSGVTQYFFLRGVDASGNLGSFSSSVAVTAD